ncbi:MAG TPA: DMT family transporter [Candidatus Eisenbacteria bacterium]|nr:DMT family transporter [Candidatus Eisenbacteria bacterium]
MSFGALETSGLSLLAAASWGGGDFSGGLAAKRASVIRVVALAHACGFAFMVLMAWLTREALPPRADLLWGAVAGAVGAFGIAALYRALAIGRMGVVAPVTAVVTGVLPVLFAVRTEGMPGRLQMLGFVLALVSIWLVARPGEFIDSHRGLGLAIFAGVMFGLFLIAGKQAGHHAVFWPLVSARFASATLMLAIVAVAPRDSRSLRSVLLPVLLSGLLDSAGNAFFIAATRLGRLDVAAVLSSLYPASTVILARLLLKERMTASQVAGIVGALVSVALISSR